MSQGPKEVKGGVFAPDDIPLIKRALQSYLSECLRVADSDREPHPDLNKAANLLHRLGRIA